MYISQLSIVCCVCVCARKINTHFTRPNGIYARNAYHSLMRNVYISLWSKSKTNIAFNASDFFPNWKSVHHIMSSLNRYAHILTRWVRFMPVQMASYKNNCDYCTIRVRFLFHTLRFKSIMPMSLPSIWTHCRYNQSKRKNAIALRCPRCHSIRLPSHVSLYLFAANINQEMVFKCRPLVETMRFKSKENIL